MTSWSFAARQVKGDIGDRVVILIINGCFNLTEAADVELISQLVDNLVIWSGDKLDGASDCRGSGAGGTRTDGT